MSGGGRGQAAELVLQPAQLDLCVRTGHSCMEAAPAGPSCAGLLPAAVTAGPAQAAAARQLPALPTGLEPGAGLAGKLGWSCDGPAVMAGWGSLITASRLGRATCMAG